MHTLIALLALALWIKITLTAIFAIAGLALVVLFALFGPGAQPETGEGSTSWITIAVVTAAAIVALWIFGGCAGFVSEGSRFSGKSHFWNKTEGGL